MVTHPFRTALALSAATVFVLPACGGDDEGGDSVAPVTDQATIDQGKTTATTSMELKAVTGNDDTSKAKVHQVGSALQGLQGRYQQAKALAAAGQVPTGSIPTGLEAAAFAQMAEEAAGGAGGAEVGSNGSIEFKDGHFTANFVFSYGNGTTTVDYTYIADMMITGETETTFDGAFDLDFSIVQDLGAAGVAAGQGGLSGTISIDYELSATFGAMVVGSCPDGSTGGKGGSLTLDYTIDISGDGVSEQAKQAYAQSGQAGSGRIVVSYAEDCTVTVAGN
jgi:hypothetical protein